MADYLEKGAIYAHLKGGTVSVWVEGDVITLSTPIYGESTTTGGETIETSSLGSCHRIEVVHDPDSLAPYFDPYFVEVCESTTDSYTTPVITIPGDLIGYETFSYATPGHFETKVLPDRLIPINGNNWDASAVSGLSFYRDGDFGFKIEEPDVVLLAGLNYSSNASSSVGYVDIKHGFLIDGNKYHVYEEGVKAATFNDFPSGKTFLIRLLGSTVYYFVNGVQVFVSSSRFNSTPYISADVAINNVEGRIYDAYLNSLPYTDEYTGEELINSLDTDGFFTGGDDTSDTESYDEGYLDGYGGSYEDEYGDDPDHSPDYSEGYTDGYDDGYGGGYGTGGDTDGSFASGLGSSSLFSTSVLDPLVAISSSRFILTIEATGVIYDSISSSSFSTKTSTPEAFEGGSVSFEPLTIFAADYDYSNAGLVFEPLEIDGFSGEIPVENSTAYMFMSSLFINSASLTGETNFPSELDFQPLEIAAYDDEYSFGDMSFEPLKIKSGTFEDIVDGVARLNEPGKGFGNATLLKSGKHLITAAHVAEIFEDLERIDVEFFASESFYVTPSKVVKIDIHPQYVQTYVAGVLVELAYDFAILTLEEEVSPFIRRHDLYTGDDDLGATYRRRSKTFQKDPVTGEKLLLEWNETFNKYELQGEAIDEFLVFDNITGQTLAYDFDNGLTLNDAFGQKFGLVQKGVEGEGRALSGDSGSAGFIGDGIIATIASYSLGIGSSDILFGTNSTYGEVGVDARVNSVQAWIQETVPEIEVAQSIESSIDLNLDIEFDIHLQSFREGDSYVHIEIESFDFDGHTGSSFDSFLEEFDVDFQSAQIPHAEFSIELESFEVTLSSSYGVVATIDSELDVEFEFNGNSGSSFDLSLEEFEFNGISISVSKSEFHIDLEEFVVDISSDELEITGFEITLEDFYLSELDSFDIVLEEFQLVDIFIDSDLKIGSNSGKALSINLTNFETTEYDNYGFDKIHRFFGEYYGISETGIYKLEGNLDVTDKMISSFTLHRFNIQNMIIARIPYCYVDSTGQIKITPFTEERLETAFKESSKIGSYVSSKNGRKTKLGKGAKGVFWSFKIENNSKGRMLLRSIELLISKSNRRV